LHYETPTEHGTFKGLMAGVGCCLLIGGLLLTVAAVILEALGVPLFGHWPKLLLATLAAFLLSQLLRFAFPSQQETEKSQDVGADGLTEDS
jgi:hypothetical protein